MSVDATDCTLLLVDDEEANLDLLAAVLRPRGYRSLVRVSDAREAAAAFREARPDLVLLDLHMPHRTGFEVLAELRELTPAGEYVPILVLTADVTREARERALASGAHDYVTKPFDRTEVLLRVRNLLETRLLHRGEARARAAAEAAAARDRLLADASRLLGASFDAGTALAQLARRVVAEWADGCVVTLHDPAGVVATAYADGRTESEAAPHAAAEGLLSASEAAAALGGDGWGSGIRVPLATRTGSAGWLALGRLAHRPPFAEAELALARELGVRAGLALENARSFQAAREEAAAREQVLTVVAHDLRSPLTAVRFEVEMLRAEPAAPLAAEDAATLLRVEQTIARMDALIQDLLDVSRVSRGVLALERRAYDPAALLGEAAATLRPLVEGQGPRFRVRGDAALPAMEVDGPRLLQAVSNLVGNAAKFARHDGEVSLEWEITGGELRIAVTDDGAGIPPEQLQHIFGAFWQARHADRRGLGLGLAIARAIVEAHGGRIWVESEPGRGSTFLISIPTA